MGKARFRWWGYIKACLRDQPRKRAVVASHGLNTLPDWEKSEYHAVEEAIRYTAALPDGKERIKLIRAVFFKRTHDLQGAALLCYVSYETAVSWHSDFIRLVAKNLGFLP